MKKYIGIDIGGTSAKLGLISSNGVVMQKGSFPTAGINSKDQFIQQLFNAIDSLQPLDAAGIGICTPGAVNSDTGIISDCVDNLPFLGQMNLKQILKVRYALPVKLCNDANAVALCEQWLGAGRDCDNFFCITFGTGIGAALVIRSRIYEGSHLRAGELCYVDYISNEVNLEKEISTKSVIAHAAKRLGLPTLDGIDFFNRLRSGDMVVAEEFAHWMDRIARVVANVITVLDPDKIIIGGGISSERDLLLPALQGRVEKMLPTEFGKDIVIDAARFSNDAGMLGAVSQLIG